MSDTLSHINENQMHMATSQNKTTSTLTHIAATQAQSSDTLTRIAATQTQSSDTLSQMAATQTQMQNTLNQISQTQTQMANSFSQVVTLLDKQSQQLHNVTSTMNKVVSVLENQQETLQNIFHVLPQALDKEITPIENLKEFTTPTMTNERPATTLQNIFHGLPQTSNQQTIQMDKPQEVTTATMTTYAPPTTTALSKEDCSDLLTHGNYPSGIYEINLGDGSLFDVRCDMDTSGGGWTVFQHRFDGSVDFYRNWNEYVEGFGSLDSEFWAGLELMHQLTSSGSWELQVQLEDFTGDTAYANYESFSIGDAASNYMLHIGSYSGTAGTYDSLSYSNNKPFSTKDRENDRWSGGHCAQDRQGAWWYDWCTHANLNGKYLGATGNGGTAMHWIYWKLSEQSLKSSTMMMRPIRSEQLFINPTSDTIMAMSMIKFVLIFSVTMVTLDNVNCQLTVDVNGIHQIVSLLENVTETSAITSSILPHLGNLLKNQTDLQTLNNILLENNTATADEMVIILPYIQEFMQLALQKMQWHHDENRDLLQNQLQKQDHIIDFILAHLDSPQENRNETLTICSQMATAQAETSKSLNEIGKTQAQMAETQTDMAVLQFQMVAAQTQTVSTLSQMSATQTEMAGTQAETLNVLTEMAEAQTEIAARYTTMNWTHMSNTQAPIEPATPEAAMNQNQTSDMLGQKSQTENRNILNQMATTQNQISDTLSHINENQMHMVGSQNKTTNMLTRIAATQTQSSDTLTRISATQTQSSDTLSQMAATQTQMQNTLNQISQTQTQMANSFSQVVTLLDKQSQQLHNVTSTMNKVVSVLENQQETLQNIFHALPQALDKQITPIENLKEFTTPTMTNERPATTLQNIFHGMPQTSNQQTIQMDKPQEVTTATMTTYAPPTTTALSKEDCSICLLMLESTSLTVIILQIVVYVGSEKLYINPTSDTIMAVSMIKFVLIFSVTMVTLDNVNCQLTVDVNGIHQIVSLLENVTETSAITSSILPHLGNLLKNQTDLQTLNNILLENNTATADEMVVILPYIQEFMQLALQKMQWHHDENRDLLQNQLQKQDHIIDVILAHLNSRQENHNETLTICSQMATAQAETSKSLNEIGKTQAEMAETQTDMAVLQFQMVAAQTQTVSTLNQMSATQTEMAGTQAETLNVLTQMAEAQTEIAARYTTMNQTRMSKTQAQIEPATPEAAMNQNQTSDTLCQKSHTQTSDILSQMAEKQTQMAVTQNQMSDTLSHINENQMDMAASQNKTTNTLTGIAATQTQSSDTLSHMAATLNQISQTQTQMANSFSQVVTLLEKQSQQMQLQSQQLHNMTATMNKVVSVLENQQETHQNRTGTVNDVVSVLEKQQETLENISNSLPLALDQRATQILLNKNSAAVINSTNTLSGSQAVALLEIQNQQIENLTDAVTRELQMQNAILLKDIFNDCSDVVSKVANPSSGNYQISLWNNLLSVNVYYVYCDMDTDGGGWTVFQHRYDGSVDFYRNWNEYVEGFGSLDGEFWAGLELIHQLTSSGSWELQVQLEAFNGDTAYANYESFSIGDAASNYMLHIGSYSGTAGDSLSYYNNRPFSTKDRDNDARSSHCAQETQGAWWYGSCAGANLNGKYLGATGNGRTAMWWYDWKSFKSLKSSTMMIRRIQ
ncbi:uncharacterized protein [Amphiura filiformis]|uniref:uncharacterized protein n=1 Tax=Amphiura filiformis TaxID=82378 RepID=UPI003B21C387